MAEGGLNLQLKAVPGSTVDFTQVHPYCNKTKCAKDVILQE